MSIITFPPSFIQIIWFVLLRRNFILILIYFFLYNHTVCADGVVRIFKVDDASSKSFKYESQETLTQYEILPKYNDACSFFLLFLLNLFTLLQVSEN